MNESEKRVKEVWPDAYAAFLGAKTIECPAFLGGPRKGSAQGWIIRRGLAREQFMPLTADRKGTEAEAWADAASRLPKVEAHERICAFCRGTGKYTDENDVVAPPMTEAKSAQPQLPPLQVDLETLRRWADGMGYGDSRPTRLVAQDLLTYLAENESLKADVELKASIARTAIANQEELEKDLERRQAEHDKALEVIREYREDHLEASIWSAKSRDCDCPTCIKADELLSRETKE